jgi:hypothetical protein
MKSTRTLWICALAVAVAVGGGAAAAVPRGKLTLIHGGEALDCRVEGLSAAGDALRVRGTGANRQIQMADIQQIDFAAVTGKTDGDLIVEPIGGSRLYGRIVSGDPSDFRMQVRGVGRLNLPLDKIRLVVNGALKDPDGGTQAVSEARKDPRETDLVLILADKVIRPFPTLVRQIDERGIHPQWDSGPPQVPWDRVYGIVFAALDRPAARAPARAVLTDGSVLAGTITAFGLERLTLRTAFAEAVTIPLSHLARVEFSSDKVVYLSDRKPARIEKAGYLGQDWPVRFDVSLTGKPISLNRVVYKKGVAVHSRTAVHYDLDGKFRTFWATIGIDDETNGLGNCIFRVTDGKGKVLFDSGDHAAKTPPRTIHVDITGVKQLVLIVDYGKDTDVGDNAVWADARVIKP